uniref:Uncharacterized protein n=1 Tax=Onchocerca volvulus TaxID=6282 RepID=A0A8R1XTL4_ONCVO
MLQFSFEQNFREQYRTESRYSTTHIIISKVSNDKIKFFKFLTLVVDGRLSIIDFRILLPNSAYQINICNSNNKLSFNYRLDLAKEYLLFLISTDVARENF